MSQFFSSMPIYTLYLYGITLILSDIDLKTYVTYVSFDSRKVVSSETKGSITVSKRIASADKTQPFDECLLRC